MVEPLLNPVRAARPGGSNEETLTTPAKRLAATIEVMKNSAELLQKASWATEQLSSKLKHNAATVSHNAQQLQFFLEDPQELQSFG